MRVPFNEALIRIGGAIVGGSAQGGTAALSAGADAYGQIQDANRAADMAEFEIAEAQRNEAKRQQIADSIARGKAAREAQEKGAAPDFEAIGAIRSGIAKLASAKEMFAQDDNSSLTGINFAALASRLSGRTFGNEDEAKRLFLNELRLDSIMNRVAETKGAISNAEMQLFASQAPTLSSNDIVWRDWIDRQMQMQKAILNRLQNGFSVDPNAPLSETMPGLSTVASEPVPAPSNNGLSSDAQSFLDGG